MRNFRCTKELRLRLQARSFYLTTLGEFFSFASRCSLGVKLRVPFKQSKHPLQALYISKALQLSLLTLCLRSFFNLKIHRLVARMSTSATTQGPLRLVKRFLKPSKGIVLGSLRSLWIPTQNNFSCCFLF